MARRQDPHLLIIATSCWKRSPGLLPPAPPHPQLGLGPLRAWEKSSAGKIPQPSRRPGWMLAEGVGSAAARQRRSGRRASIRLSLFSCCNRQGAIAGCSSRRLSHGSRQGYLLERGTDLKPALANKGVLMV